MVTGQDPEHGEGVGNLLCLAASKDLQVLSKTLIDGKAADVPNLGAPIYTTASVANEVLYVATQTHHTRPRGREVRRHTVCGQAGG